MLLSLLFGGDIKSILISTLFCIPIIMLSLSLHELAHGFVALKCGDRTAYAMGRLTLNPLRHLDPIGFLMMMLIGIGYAKPVPINSRNFRHPRGDMALVAAAGPIANILLGALSACLFGIFNAWYAFRAATVGGTFATSLLYYTALFFYMSGVLNFGLAIFNLLPLPQLDGSRIAYLFLPPKAYFGIMRYERQILLGFLLAFIILERVFGFYPISDLAESLTYLISNPITNLFLEHVFIPML